MRPCMARCAVARSGCRAPGAAGPAPRQRCAHRRRAAGAVSPKGAGRAGVGSSGPARRPAPCGGPGPDSIGTWIAHREGAPVGVVADQRRGGRPHPAPGSGRDRAGSVASSSAMRLVSLRTPEYGVVSGRRAQLRERESADRNSVASGIGNDALTSRYIGPYITHRLHGSGGVPSCHVFRCAHACALLVWLPYCRWGWARRRRPPSWWCPPPPA
uniref:Uncharacterized protein n=1 Tax=Ralstonia solanacearum TaxID=305 RepID=A0A0S4WQR7_RALSL|nr:protein of unknown function [Ralstonia solanacearum]